MFIIFDLDGTLSDHSKRLHHVKNMPRNYDAYYDECDQDAPIKSMIELFHQLVQAGNRVEIWTGRVNRVIRKTNMWLINMGIMDSYLTRMRPDGDFSPDFVLKGKWLKEELDKGCSPDLVFEDRSTMVSYWRSQGITCCDVGEL